MQANLTPSFLLPVKLQSEDMEKPEKNESTYFSPSYKKYKETLQKAANNIKNTDGGEQCLYKLPLWEELYGFVSQEVLKDASECMIGIFAKLCKNRNIIVQPRPEKTMARLEIKKQERTPPNYFKLVSDYAAGRIFCLPCEIEQHVLSLKEMAFEEGGWYAVRGAGGDGFGSHKKAEKFVDIVQYVFIYLPSVGHVIELQIGHPFAAETFRRDSYLRDHKNHSLPENQLEVDLWENDFYNFVKSYILEKSNHPSGQDLSSRKEECWKKAKALFEQYASRIPMNENLKNILLNL